MEPFPERSVTKVGGDLHHLTCRGVGRKAVLAWNHSGWDFVQEVKKINAPFPTKQRAGTQTSYTFTEIEQSWGPGYCITCPTQFCDLSVSLG